MQNKRHCPQTRTSGYSCLRRHSVLSRHRYRLIVRVLSLALLIAQLGAQAHASSHLVIDPPGVPSTIQNCGQCLSFAPLLSAVSGSQSVWLAARCEAECLVSTPTILIANQSPCPAFQSRAPPELL